MNWRIWALGLTGLAIVIALIMIAGVSPWAAAKELYEGSLGSRGALNGTLKETTPLLIAGIAVYVALRAGLFNIGVEGQLVVGAMCCAMVALRVPGVAGLLLGTLVGCFAGAAWALPAGLIKAYKGGHEVITTIMLNNVAGQFTHYMVAGPIKAPGQMNTTTEDLAVRTMYPLLYSDPPLRLSSAMLVGVFVLVLFAFWLKRSVAGYELDLVGKNPRAAELAGVATKRVTLFAMLASGALAGLAGSAMVLAYEGRFFAGFSPGYGFDALGVAILAGNAPLMLIVSALFFGILNKGAAAIQIVGIPKGISTIILGLLIVVFAAMRYTRRSSDGR